MTDGIRHQRIGFIDLHQDMLAGVARLEGGFPSYGSAYLTGASHAAAIWSALYPAGAERHLLRQLGDHADLLEAHSASLRLVTSVADLDVDDGRTGVLPHSEGLHLPGIDPDTLNRLWSEHALRSLSLTWNYETEYGFGCYDDDAAPLKPLGRRLVRALGDTPLMLDLAHLNVAGYHDALDLYTPPVLVTHSFCRSIGDHPRGLTDDQVRALGEHGGLIGLAFDPDFLGAGSVDEALRHIDRIATLAGEGAVSIGSDWGVAPVGELDGQSSLGALFGAIVESHGTGLAERFAYGNAYDFLAAELPVSLWSLAELRERAEHHVDEQLGRPSQSVGDR